MSGIALAAPAVAAQELDEQEAFLPQHPAGERQLVPHPEGAGAAAAAAAPGAAACRDLGDTAGAAAAAAVAGSPEVDTSQLQGGGSGAGGAAGAGLDAIQFGTGAGRRPRNQLGGRKRRGDPGGRAYSRHWSRGFVSRCPPPRPAPCRRG